MGAGAATFYKNYDALTSIDGGRRVLAFDWLGMGRSSRPRYPKRNAVFPQNVTSMEFESIEWFVGSMESWRQSMGLEKFDLVAHSMGAYFCVLYAIRHPHRVNRLVLVSPCGLPEMPLNTPSSDTYSLLIAPRGSATANFRAWWTNLLIILWGWNITPQDIIRLTGPLLRGFVERCVVQR